MIIQLGNDTEAVGGLRVFIFVCSRAYPPPPIGVRVGRGVGVFEGITICVGVLVGVTGVLVLVGVTGVFVAVLVGVLLGVTGVLVAVLDGVLLGVTGVLVGVLDGVLLGVTGVLVGVLDAVGVIDGVAVENGTAFMVTTQPFESPTLSPNALAGTVPGQFGSALR